MIWKMNCNMHNHNNEHPLPVDHLLRLMYLCVYSIRCSMRSRRWRVRRAAATYAVPLRSACVVIHSTTALCASCQHLNQWVHDGYQQPNVYVSGLTYSTRYICMR